MKTSIKNSERVDDQQSSRLSRSNSTANNATNGSARASLSIPQQPTDKRGSFSSNVSVGEDGSNYKVVSGSSERKQSTGSTGGGSTSGGGIAGFLKAAFGRRGSKSGAAAKNESLSTIASAISSNNTNNNSQSLVNGSNVFSEDPSAAAFDINNNNNSVLGSRINYNGEGGASNFRLKGEKLTIDTSQILEEVKMTSLSPLTPGQTSPSTNIELASNPTSTTRTTDTVSPGTTITATAPGSHQASPLRMAQQQRRRVYSARPLGSAKNHTLDDFVRDRPDRANAEDEDNDDELLFRGYLLGGDGKGDNLSRTRTASTKKDVNSLISPASRSSTGNLLGGGNSSKLLDSNASNNNGNGNNNNNSSNVTNLQNATTFASPSYNSNNSSRKFSLRQRTMSAHPNTSSNQASSGNTSNRHTIIETNSIESKVEDHLNGTSQINQYLILKDIGQGSFGSVKLCMNVDDKLQYAMKMISKKRLKKKLMSVGPTGANGRMMVPPKRARGRVQSLSLQPESGSAGSSTGDIPLPNNIPNVNISVTGVQGELPAASSTNLSPVSPRSQNLDASSNSIAVPDFMTQVRREIAILKKISNHPNITSLIEVLDDTKEDMLYMVFELCENGPIMNLKLNEKTASLGEEKSRKYLRDVLLALEYLHHKRIIHRDIKPENILLDRVFTAKIADFGISSLCEEEGGNSTSSYELKISEGSPAFSSPELLTASNSSKVFKIRCQSDIWALGISLYCMTHGRCPFESSSIITLYQQILNDTPVLDPNLTFDLKDLLTKMLAKDPLVRITLPEIRTHPWVTLNGTMPMMSSEENCNRDDNVTEEEVTKAVKPAISFLSRILGKFKLGSNFNLSSSNNTSNNNSNVNTNRNSANFGVKDIPIAAINNNNNINNNGSISNTNSPLVPRVNSFTNLAKGIIMGSGAGGAGRSNGASVQSPRRPSNNNNINNNSIVSGGMIESRFQKRLASAAPILERSSTTSNASSNANNTSKMLSSTLESRKNSRANLETESASTTNSNTTPITTNPPITTTTTNLTSSSTSNITTGKKPIPSSPLFNNAAANNNSENSLVSNSNNTLNNKVINEEEPISSSNVKDNGKNDNDDLKQVVNKNNNDNFDVNNNNNSPFLIESGANGYGNEDSGLPPPLLSVNIADMLILSDDNIAAAASDGVVIDNNEAEDAFDSIPAPPAPIPDLFSVEPPPELNSNASNTNSNNTGNNNNLFSMMQCIDEVPSLSEEKSER